MEKSSVIIVCILVACSVWIFRRGSHKVNDDYQELAELAELAKMADMSAKASKIPGVCWACNWVLKKVKEAAGSKPNVQKLTSLLNSFCDKTGLVKSWCHKFVKTHLKELLKELMSTEDVRQICVDTGACKSEELLDLHLYEMDKLK